MIEIIIAFFLALWPSHPHTTTTDGNGTVIIGVQADGPDTPPDSTSGDTEPIPPKPLSTRP
ncbi:hypothetical protein SAMN04487894_10338 [Niabella drilacis]|uniref:Uncharacterized protein n=1 Tax=Niabella drilacis (strain DSM 25811 / CCM 8410 / CCUG 62505 / LMG 26954 / E90) TaxID=1285928 RepID=A0A1G6MU18_NIADE|nr:hypothetical protein SAMN04487894_10338 [Niabella drilacis]